MEKYESRIVILTALKLEQDAVLAKLTDVRQITHPGTGTIYHKGHVSFKGKEISIVSGLTGQTNINAGVETERIIEFFSPEYLFFIGVAGGIKDVKIGDVVIGSDVIGYERGKQEDEFKFRPQFGFSSYALEKSAVSFSGSDAWEMTANKILKPGFGGSIDVYAGTIASGEKVIASTDAEIYRAIRQFASHAIAVEMEGLGFLEACRPYPLIKSLLIRGISDTIEGKETSDKGGSQPYAVAVATEFLFGLLATLDISVQLIHESIEKQLNEICPKLYPEGIRHNGIWTRAGGDLSMIHLYTTGKAQWAEALRMIQNGGGGEDLSFKNLIQVMLSDYPSNQSLKSVKI